METLGAAYRALAPAAGAAGAREVLARRAGMDWADLIARPDTPLPPDIRAQLARDLEHLSAGAPPGRVLGVRAFWGRDYALSPETLEPRPETEALIAVALDGPAPARILDLGTGTGCILISLLAAWPGAWGLGTDIAPGALRTARKNAITHGVSDRAALTASDWGAALAGRFALITANPPYIRAGDIAHLEPAVRAHDPHAALDGGADGLDAYRAIVVDIARLLSPGGRALLEIGYDQADAVVTIARGAGLRVGHVHTDLGGRPRVVAAFRGDNL
jgi:release factor glutamine methyltransferase